MWTHQPATVTAISSQGFVHESHGRSGSTVVYSGQPRVLNSDKPSLTPELVPRPTVRVSNTVWTPVRSPPQKVIMEDAHTRGGSESQATITIRSRRGDNSETRVNPPSFLMPGGSTEFTPTRNIYTEPVNSTREQQPNLTSHKALIERTSSYVGIQPPVVSQTTVRLDSSFDKTEAAVAVSKETNTRLKAQLSQVRFDRDRIMRSNESLMARLTTLSEKLHLKVFKRIQERGPPASNPTNQTTSSTTRAEHASSARYVGTSSRGVYASLTGPRSQSRQPTN